MSGHEYKKFKVPNNAEIKLAMYSDKNIITVLMANPYYMQKIIDIKFYEHIDFSDLFYKDLKMTARGNKLSIIVPPLYSGSFSLKIK
ncbi:hypothetical protein ACQ86O_23100 [Serratia sp. L9]|uniref:hypothetical protein n=1 Tax=Serratia sp. L9 TaxID=3423946 RepID=UPI003D667DAC